jgi:hemerythrin
MDDQHKELFARINLLLAASGQGKGRDEVLKTVQFLESYVVTHFTDEEALMTRAGFPGLTAHRQEHAAFVDDVAKIKAEYLKSGASTVLVIQVQRRVVDWLKNHIGREDKEYGAYLTAKGR